MAVGMDFAVVSLDALLSPTKTSFEDDDDEDQSSPLTPAQLAALCKRTSSLYSTDHMPQHILDALAKTQTRSSRRSTMIQQTKSTTTKVRTRMVDITDDASHTNSVKTSHPTRPRLVLERSYTTGSVPLSAAALQKNAASFQQPVVESDAEARLRTRVAAWEMEVERTIQEQTPIQEDHEWNDQEHNLDALLKSPKPSLSVVIPEPKVDSAIGAREVNHGGLPTPAVSKFNQKIKKCDIPMTAPPTVHPSFLQDSHSRSSSLNSQKKFEDSDASSFSRKSSHTSIDTSDNDQNTPIQAHIKAIKESQSSRTPHKTHFGNLTPSRYMSGTNLDKPLPASPFNDPLMSARSPRTMDSGLRTPLSSKTSKGNFRVFNPSNLKGVKGKTPHRLDLIDSEFMSSNPHSGMTDSPTNMQVQSEFNDVVSEIRPLSISRRRPGQMRSVSSDTGLKQVPYINIVRANTVDIAPPPRSAKRLLVRTATNYEAQHQHLISGPPQPIINHQLSPATSDFDPLAIIDQYSKFSPLEEQNGGYPALRIPQETSPLTVQRFDSSSSPSSNLVVPNTFVSPSARLSIFSPSPFEELLSAHGLTETTPWLPNSPNALQTARAAAETALLRIMAALGSLEDLANTACINKGMRRVYKQNELPLLQAVLKTESVTAWELRQWSTLQSYDQSPESGECEHNCDAMVYRSHAMRDRATIQSLKSLIVTHCRSFIRSDTLDALLCKDDPDTKRFENAFYRIWTFCKIFGSGTGRENDIQGQMDWLDGGYIAQQKSNHNINPNSILNNPPDYFGASNGYDGLTADDLNDMIELWKCLTTLLQSYSGKLSQARTHGIFASCHIPRSTPQETKLVETAMLEEWLYHILSLGPSAILKLAECSSDTNSGFALASLNGWMDWSPPVSSTSRSSFLRDTVSRLYDQRCSQLLSPPHATLTANDRAAIAQRRFEPDHNRLTVSPPTRPGFERTPSIASSVTLVGKQTPVDSPSSAFPRSPGMKPLQQAPVSSLNRRGGTSPPFGGNNTRINRIEEEVYSQQQQQQPRQRTKSLDSAVQRIVMMGFTPAQAREALEKTLIGVRADIDVDGAVNFLLKRESELEMRL